MERICRICRCILFAILDQIEIYINRDTSKLNSKKNTCFRYHAGSLFFPYMPTRRHVDDKDFIYDPFYMHISRFSFYALCA